MSYFSSWKYSWMIVTRLFCYSKSTYSMNEVSIFLFDETVYFVRRRLHLFYIYIYIYSRKGSQYLNSEIQ